MKTIKELKNEKSTFLGFEDIINVISDFENINISSEEYHSYKSKHSNIEYFIEEKIKMEEALKSNKYKNIHIVLAYYV